jgi:hypothetical protein
MWFGLAMKVGMLDRLGVFHPGLVRTRRGTQAVCATVLTWATMVAVAGVAGVGTVADHAIRIYIRAFADWNALEFPRVELRGLEPMGKCAKTSLAALSVRTRSI